MFEGVHTALVTPFHKGEIDSEVFRDLIELQIVSGVDGIVPMGTTGESPTLTHEEHHRVIQLAVETVNGRCKVIAGTGSNSTAEAIDLTKEAEALGADAALLVAPYYNKPSQEGLFQHFSAISHATKIPLILYNIPGRCSVEIGIETVVRLAKACPRIVAIKEAGGSVERVSQLRQALPPSFEILSGDDSLTLPFLATGALGVISVASNIIPKIIVQMVQAWSDGHPQKAQEIHERYYPLFKNLFIETNPVPVKHALSIMGRCQAEVRLPLYPPTPENAERIRQTLASLDIFPKK